MSEYDILGSFVSSTPTVNIGGVELVGSFSSTLSKAKISSSVFQKEKIQFSLEKGLKYLSFLQRFGSYPYRNMYLSPLGEDANFIKRFLISLDAYIETGTNKMLPDEIISGTFTRGPLYATYLKRLRIKAFITSSFSSYMMEEPDWWNEIPLYTIDNDIGEIFNYAYLPHWIEGSEDYLEGFRPLRYDKRALTLFKETLKNLLSKDIPLVHPDEILMSISGSTTFDYSQMYKTKFKHLSFSKKRGVCRRCVLSVGPENCRDTVINKIEDFNTISLIEKQTQVLLRTLFPDKTIGVSPERFNARYKNLTDNFNFFLCRDFTKEGITKPRFILRAMLEVLHDRYPDLPAYNYPGFFDEYQVELDDGSIITPTRGHGLGMANALTTLMQIVIVIMSQVEAPYNFKSEIDFMTENDDIIIAFKKRSDVDLYWDAEGDILSDLGLIRNPKKSFFGHISGVFIERYFRRGFPNINKKESYHRREVLQTLNACNITQAKQYVSSLVYTPIEYVKEYIEEIIFKYGYEFFRDEVNYPSTLGGWYNHSIYGVRLDLRSLDDLDYNDKVYRAFRACKHNQIQPRISKLPFNHPILHMHPLLDLSDLDRERLNIQTSIATHQNYSRLKFKPEQYYVAWKKLQMKRQKEYLTIKEATYESFIIEFLDHYKKMDFYPPESHILKMIPCEEFKGRISDHYHCSNPNLAYINYLYGKDNYYKDVESNPWGLISHRFDDLDFRSTADQRKRLSRFIGVQSNIIFPMYEDTFLLPKDEFRTELFSKYYNPLNVAKVSQLFEVKNLVPIPNWDRDEIKIREKVFGRILTSEEMRFLTLLREERGEELYIHYKGLLKEFKLFEIKMYLDEVVKPLRKDIKDLVESSSENDDDSSGYESPADLNRYINRPRTFDFVKVTTEVIEEQKIEEPKVEPLIEVKPVVEEKLEEEKKIFYSGYWEWYSNPGQEDWRVPLWQHMRLVYDGYNAYLRDTQMGIGFVIPMTFSEWSKSDKPSWLGFRLSVFMALVPHVEELYSINKKPKSDSSSGEGGFNLFEED